MRDLSAPDLLSAWDHACGQPPVRQALALLSAAHPECSPEQLATLTIGQRNLRLLALRERWFGARLTAVTTCPRCGHAVELSFLASQVRTEPAADGEDLVPARPARVLVAADGYRVECRLPTTVDLSALEAIDDASQARTELLRRCVLSVEREEPEPGEDDARADPSTLPALVVEAVAEGLSAADPHADTMLSLACPDCAHAWQAPLDIASYLFAEVHAWARRLLHEVHDLASAYGWREADILAMAPARRRAYRQLLGLA
jgi:hypothetical protein